jgi:hypothetical protein
MLRMDDHVAIFHRVCSYYQSAKVDFGDASFEPQWSVAPKIGCECLNLLHILVSSH